jgi:hypothetical protein
MCYTFVTQWAGRVQVVLHLCNTVYRQVLHLCHTVGRRCPGRVTFVSHSRPVGVTLVHTVGRYVLYLCNIAGRPCPHRPLLRSQKARRVMKMSRRVVCTRV